MTRTIHVAAAPIGDVQDCARCGKVLLDNRGIDVQGERWLLTTFFPVGSEVAATEDRGGHTLTGPGVVMLPGEHSIEAMRAYKALDTACIPSPETP